MESLCILLIVLLVLLLITFSATASFIYSWYREAKKLDEYWQNILAQTKEINNKTAEGLIKLEAQITDLRNSVTALKMRKV